MKEPLGFPGTTSQISDGRNRARAAEFARTRGFGLPAKPDDLPHAIEFNIIEINDMLYPVYNAFVSMLSNKIKVVLATKGSLPIRIEFSEISSIFDNHNMALPLKDTEKQQDDSILKFTELDDHNMTENQNKVWRAVRQRLAQGGYKISELLPTSPKEKVSYFQINYKD